jgi:hypothetical protein
MCMTILGRMSETTQNSVLRSGIILNYIKRNYVERKVPKYE